MAREVLAKGSAVLTGATTVTFTNIDLNLVNGRKVTVAIAYADLTTFTGVTALLEWGVESEATQFAAGESDADVADTGVVGTVNGAYSGLQHVGGDKARIVLTPAGVPGTVTVHYVVIG